MDFSKKGTLKKQHQVKSTAVKMASKANIMTFRLVILLTTVAAIVGVVAVTGAVKAMIEETPDLSNLNVIQTGYASSIYDSEGTLNDILVGAQGYREYVRIERIPKIVRDCFVALEDERFYEHNGIDVRGWFRTAFSVVKPEGLDYERSTITQKLLRQQVFNGGNEGSTYDKIKRKIQEQYLAVVLEEELDKDLILEYYLNIINFGNGAWGIQTAAKSYFNKNVWDLTLSEAAVLAPICISSVKLNPGNYPEANAEYRMQTLNRMRVLGFCSEEEYQEAIEDNVYERIQAIAAAKEEDTYNSYFNDEVIAQVFDDLVKAGYTEEQADKMIYSGGLSIYSTQDPQIQDICDEVYADTSRFPKVGEGSYYELNYALSIVKADGMEVHYQLDDLKNYFKKKVFLDPEDLYVHSDGYYFTEFGYDRTDMIEKCEEFRNAMVKEGDKVSGERQYITLQPQSSLTIIDQATGYVAAIVGGREEMVGDRMQNRAASTLRQAGTTFQVLAAFLPALDTAGLTLASVQDDAKYFYPSENGKDVNWGIDRFEGLTDIRRGIYGSKNIVAVKTLVQIGSQLGFDYLKKLGFAHLVEKRNTESGKVYSDISPMLALGELTDGVTNLELTAAYAAIANGGSYIKPIFYTKVVDQNGNIILSNETTPSRVIKASTAYLLTDAMKDSITKGPESILRFREYAMPVAGKTGKTEDTNDLWFVGFTPYYTAGIWSGYDNNRFQENTTYHYVIWREIMERIHKEKELEYQSFEAPDTIVSAVICRDCGKLAIDGLCSHALGGSAAETELFAKGTVPSEPCSCHLTVTVCKESGKFATEFCPETESVVYLVKQETSETNDTSFILPSGSDTTCLLHVGGGIPEDFGPPLSGREPVFWGIAGGYQ